MDKVFMLNGGAGRVLTSIPAFRKYKIKNPHSNFKIIIWEWEFLFHAEKDLMPHVVSAYNKGLFEEYIKDRDLCVLEPYYLQKYYSGNSSLAESFDYLINETDDHSDLEDNYFHIFNSEKHMAKTIVNDFKKISGKNNIVVFQPFGSSAELVGDGIIDQTSRSLSLDKAMFMAEQLGKHCNVLYFGPENFLPTTISNVFNIHHLKANLRSYASIIEQADAFVGIDSVGQHFASNFNKKCFIMMGGTIERNVSYPSNQNFKFFRHGALTPKYIPMRINDYDCTLANMHNDGIMDFSEQELSNIIQEIRNSFRHEHFRT